MNTTFARKFLVLSGVLILSACATAAPIQMSATGGSKADGIVEMSYEYGEFQQPVIDTEQGMASAVKRCKAWGYKKAAPFDGGVSMCIIPGGFSGCAKMRQTISYQCTH